MAGSWGGCGRVLGWMWPSPGADAAESWGGCGRVLGRMWPSPGADVARRTYNRSSAATACSCSHDMWSPRRNRSIAVAVCDSTAVRSAFRCITIHQTTQLALEVAKAFRRGYRWEKRNLSPQSNRWPWTDWSHQAARIIHLDKAIAGLCFRSLESHGIARTE